MCEGGQGRGISEEVRQGKRSQLTNHVLPYVCMGVPISLLYPSYLVSIMFFVVSNTSSSLVPFANDFLGYHLADLCYLRLQGKLLYM